MKAEWPQIVWIVLTLLGLLVTAQKHGKPRDKEEHNIFTRVIVTGIIAFLLFKGGFFTY